jgi:hypothetical protein
MVFGAHHGVDGRAKNTTKVQSQLEQVGILRQIMRIGVSLMSVDEMPIENQQTPTKWYRKNKGKERQFSGR